HQRPGAEPCRPAPGLPGHPRALRLPRGTHRRAALGRGGFHARRGPGPRPARRPGRGRRAAALAVPLPALLEPTLVTGHAYDALVIGGGPAGATAALLLARAGWSVVLFEKKSFPRRKVCGEYLSATSLPLLDRLGVGEQFRDLAGPPVCRVGLFA